MEIYKSCILTENQLDKFKDNQGEIVNLAGNIWGIYGGMEDSEQSK